MNCFFFKFNSNNNLKVFRGDLEDIERSAYELCQAGAEAGVIYQEVHYTPQFFLQPKAEFSPVIGRNDDQDYRLRNEMTAKDVVKAVNRGLERGMKSFKIEMRSILILIRTKPEWSKELLNLAIEFKNKGVVGIDIAGDIIGATTLPNEAKVINGDTVLVYLFFFKDSFHIVFSLETLMFQREHVNAFQRAAQMGIKRVVHAGLFGPSANVVGALNVLMADRIAHGYRMLEDDQFYRQMIQLGVHFETTPSSATLIATGDDNPVVRFARDGITFSINTDSADELVDEYRILAERGITAKRLQQSVSIFLFLIF